MLLMPFFVLALAGLAVAFVTHVSDSFIYRMKLESYRSHGGKPYVNPRFATNKAAWEEQNEINKRAREIARL